MGKAFFKKFVTKKGREKLGVGVEGNFKLDVVAKFPSKKEMVTAQGSHIRNLETKWMALLHNFDHQVSQMCFNSFQLSCFRPSTG